MVISSFPLMWLWSGWIDVNDGHVVISSSLSSQLLSHPLAHHLQPAVTFVKQAEQSPTMALQSWRRTINCSLTILLCYIRTVKSIGQRVWISNTSVVDADRKICSDSASCIGARTDHICVVEWNCRSRGVIASIAPTTRDLWIGHCADPKITDHVHISQSQCWHRRW